MKYVIINGSPRRKNTWKMVEYAKNNLKGDFEEIHLMKEKIPLCNGCYNCIVEGEDKCPHNDKIKPIIDKMKEADGIIIACPVYALNVTALLKNFFDHTAYLYHRPEFFTKKALVVVSTAGIGQKDVAKYIDETLRHWGVNKVYKITYAYGAKDLPDIKNIDEISKKFGKDVESKKLHGPKLGDIVFFEVFDCHFILTCVDEEFLAVRCDDQGSIALTDVDIIHGNGAVGYDDIFLFGIENALNCRHPFVDEGDITKCGE